MTGFASSYLGRQKEPSSAIPVPPSDRTNLIVVIPVFCEPRICDVLDSIWKCDRPKSYTEVILVVNEPENASLEIRNCNKHTLDLSLDWIRKHSDDSLCFFVMHEILPPKDAGVGLARKIGMDEALRRFNRMGNSRGFILSLDADSLIDSNYFRAIEEEISINPATKGIDIYFEHPVSGTEFPEKVYSGIIQYELHLRYVNLSLKISGFPYAHHTVGSCFGVRADIYAEQGGMNRKKGGEDFYFLHKIIPLGNFSDICATRVIPSPRESFRVPFGTGPAISKYLESGKEMLTYDADVFGILKSFFELVPSFYKAGSNRIQSLVNPLHRSIREFLQVNDYIKAIGEINDNSGSPENFRNRFFRWFDAFRIVKYLNFSAREYFPKVPVTVCARQLIKKMGYDVSENTEPLILLNILRGIERNK